MVIVAADGAMEGAHDPHGVVVGPLEVGGPAVAAELDGAGLGQRPVVAGGPEQVGVRLEAEPPRVLDPAPHQVAGQLDRRRHRRVVVAAEVLTQEAGQAALAQPSRGQRVLDAEAVGVDEVAADRHVPSGTTRPARHQHRDQAGPRTLPGTCPVGPAPPGVHGQPGAPAGAHPAARHGGRGRARPLLAVDRPHQGGDVPPGHPEHPGDLVGRGALAVQLPDPVLQFEVVHDVVVPPVSRTRSSNQATAPEPWR